MTPFEEKIVSNLKDKSCFTKEDVEENFKKHGLVISDDALNIKIFRWRKKGLIQDVAKGKYVINNKTTFIPESDKFIKKIHKLFSSRFDDLDYCIWSTSWFANYMHHVPFQSFYVLETEKDICESAFYHLKDNGINAYYEIDSKQIEKYILPEDDSIIIRPLITRAPCKKLEKISYASIEKILVDIFCDQNIFYLYSGREQQWIFENILKAYNINFSTLLTYAERRKRDKELRSFLLTNFNESVKNIIE
jgi:hypothetical protein